MNDPFTQWLDALEPRHTQTLRFQELRRAIQALSSLYVERRGRIGRGMALDGVGKRAAFACYFAPLHFLLVRETVRSLGAGNAPPGAILDLGCGTGAAGAAWALEMDPRPKVIGVDRSPWALHEAKWTYGAFGLQASVSSLDVDTLRLPPDTGVIAAFAVNEMAETSRDRVRRELLTGARRGAPILVIEAIARRPAPWWAGWAKEWKAVGGLENEWRFQVQLPERLRVLDKAAGLNHRELTGRSLWLPGQAEQRKSSLHMSEPGQQPSSLKSKLLI